jgi:tetratricopeptide (TPR) repeat protein
MDGAWEPQLETEIDAIARRIRFAKREGEKLGRTIFLIGAGCSLSAGIPGAVAIAQRMVRETALLLRLCEAGADAAAAYAALVRDGALTAYPKGEPGAGADAGVDWYAVYDAMFRLHYTAPDDVRRLFSGLVEEANGAVNWAHLCLGEIVARDLVSTVLTTNFDQLVLSGMVRAGVLPVVCDGIESLNRIDGAPRHPQLVELHGSRHTYLLRNAPEDVAKVGRDPQAVAAIQKLFQTATTFVAVGYGGREAGVMDLLVQAGRAYPDKTLYWVAHSPRPEDAGKKVRDFLATSRHARLVPGQDADRFFLELCQALRIGSPRAVSSPLEGLRRLIGQVRASAVTDPDIEKEIAAAEAGLAALEAGAATARGPDDTGAATAIREARLRGDLAGAFARAEQAVAGRELAGVPAALLEEAGRAALDHGEQHPETGPLMAGVVWLRALVERPADRAEGAQWRVLLGDALWRLGEREAETARLEEAVAVYRAALEEHTRDRVPLEWARTQNNLGNALSVLGEREAVTARLEEAVAAYRAALEERTRERVPLAWATTQNNLGSALRALGEREDGTARLEEAVAAYRAALEERPRARVPLAWAGAQNNLGVALQALGAREDGTARLEEAVAVLGAALEERTRERVPLDWAMTQNNLGTALWVLGEREDGTARLEEAVAAFRAALEVGEGAWPAGWVQWTKDRIVEVEREIGRRRGGG